MLHESPNNRDTALTKVKYLQKKYVNVSAGYCRLYNHASTSIIMTLLFVLSDGYTKSPLFLQTSKTPQQQDFSDKA